MPGGRPPKRRNFYFNKGNSTASKRSHISESSSRYSNDHDLLFIEGPIDYNMPTTSIGVANEEFLSRGLEANDLRTQVDNDLRTQVDNDLPAQVDNDLPTQVDNDMPTQVDNDLRTQVDNDLPTQVGNEVTTTSTGIGSGDLTITLRPPRIAKAACIDRLLEITSDLNELQSPETVKKRSQRLQKMRLHAAETRNNETSEERQERLQIKRLHDKETRGNETIKQRQQRLENLRLRTAEARANETIEQRQQRLGNLRLHTAEARANETIEQRQKRLGNLRLHTAEARTNETIEQRQQRLENLRLRTTEARANEPIQRRQQRLEEQRRRNNRRQRALEVYRLPTYKLAVQSIVHYHSLGAFNVVCGECGALHFPEERVGNQNSFGNCCLHGRIKLPHAEFPNELAKFFLKSHPLSSDFHKRIRSLNCSYAMASFTVDDDRTINNRGVYSFIANGQVYHKINVAAQPTQNSQGVYERPQYGQIYYLDSEDAVNERINNPINQGIDINLIQLIEQIFRSQNPFAQGFMMMREIEEEINRNALMDNIPAPYVRLLFTLPEGVDHRRFDVPASNEVCAVITLNADQSFPDNELIIRQRGKSLQIMKNIDKRVEPFTYPLFYPKGTFGFSIDLPLSNCYASRDHITRLELAQYRLAFRPKIAKFLTSNNQNNDPDLRSIPFNALHFGGRLFQQYLVDTYIRVEHDRIQWIKLNQKKILADNYTSVTNFLNAMSEKHNAVVGEKVVLPSSFPGSTRYYSEHFEDAMALVRRFGSPDFFLTMTCNPDWPEIKEAIHIIKEDGSSWQQLAQDRPDIVARVAKQKFNKIIDDLDKKQIFGKTAAYVHTIEFQKRGLPHMHLLIIMAPEARIHSNEELDDLISAEIPDMEDDPELRELVLKWMIHNACGVHNQKASCMVNRNGIMQCRFTFPKNFLDVTSLVDDGKPNYRRRYDPKLDPNNPEFVHEEAVYRKDDQGRRITRDNRHVASYNKYLLKKFNCHINVEYVGSIRAIKYIYKYIYKGHDCASIEVIENQSTINYNEANKFVQGRCVTPPEACWRLFGYEIQKKSHAVQRLDIHMPGQYRFQSIEQVQEDLVHIGQKGSTLEAYFRHNASLKRRQQENNNQERITFYYYWQMPEFFVWNGKSSEWKPRLRNRRVIGRIHNVTFVAQPELYHLRLLLYHVNDAKNFEDLLMVGDDKYDTYKQACLARGLTYDDRQWIDGLRESALSKMGKTMRTLFSQILIFGSPENPKKLWDLFKEDLAEDFIRRGDTVEDSIKQAYKIIAYKLNTEATEGRNFRYWVKRYNMDDIDDIDDNNEINDELLHFDQIVDRANILYGNLKGRQRVIVDSILNATDNQNIESKCFFIDGPGGTGKTYIYKTLYYKLLSDNRKVKCMAYTGIASILLPEGCTAHKTFGLKVPLTSESTSNIKPGSAKARELAQVDVFLMDEAPMLPKYGLHTMDLLLRALGNPNLPFGGKVFVLGGDFRQCLPVQPRANRSELLDLSIKKSFLWKHFNLFSLTENMRVDPAETEFANYLLLIGNGELTKNMLDEIEIQEDIISGGDLIEEVYGNSLISNTYEEMKDRAILAPLNKDVEKINADIIEKIPGEVKIYKSYDSIKDPSENDQQFTSEFLNSINIADLPPHELKLKKNTIIILIRNLDVSEGLCNGVRLIISDLCNNIIKAKIITGEHANKEVHIPRITLDSSKCQLGCTMQRHQFPVRPAFAMTIHKAQGQTFEFVGIDLKNPVFMHGMLYVAFSRVKRRSNLRVLLRRENPLHTFNVVWKEVLSSITN